MKRSLSASLLEGNNSSKVPKSSYTFDYVSELINNRLSDQLKSCLENSFKHINLKNDDSLLMKACKVGDEECVKLLIAHGADVSFVSHYSGYTALTLACRFGRESIAKLLLEHGGEINPETGLLPLVEACKAGNLDVAELLLNSGARVDEHPQVLCKDDSCYENRDDYDPHYHDGLNPIMIASKTNHTGLVKLLLQHGAVETILDDLPLDSYDIYGFSALTFASKCYHWETVKALITNKFNVDELNGAGTQGSYHPSPLMYACKQGDIEVVKELIELGADINAARWESTEISSALITASARGHIDIVKFILEHKNFTAVETVA